MLIVRAELRVPLGWGKGSPHRLNQRFRAKVLIRHKRLYLVSTTGICMLFMLPVASVCKHDKAKIRPVQEGAGEQ